MTTMGPEQPTFPFRQLSRVATEFHASAAGLISDLAPGDYTKGVLSLQIARLCLDDWYRPDGILLPDPATMQWHTPHGVATMLARPAETIRRKLNAMVEEGHLIRSAAGVALDPSPAGAERWPSYYRRVHDLMIRLIEDARDTCDMPFPLPVPDATPPPPAKVTACALDVLLLPHSPDRMMSADWLLGGLWIVLSAFNIRRVTYDPILCRRYRTAPSPDELRMPASLRQVAGALHVPYATAWRSFRRMADAGLVTRVEQGWIVSGGSLAAEHVEEKVVANMRYIVRKMHELVAAGLDIRSIATHYAVSRPPLLTSPAR